MSRVGCREFLEALSPEESRESVGRRLRQDDPRLHKAFLAERKRLLAMCVHESEHWNTGSRWVAGADEVGRGPLAGPLVAAAVCFEDPPWIPWLKDSKLLKPEQREAIFPWIHHQAASVSVAVIDVEEVNSGNLHHLSLEAMKRAVTDLHSPPDHLLVDGRYPLVLDLPQTCVIKGDRRCVSIAAASIIAKVTRDRIMIELDREYPGYNFASHKGYATAEHQEALTRLGPSPIHRTTFAPVRQAMQARLFQEPRAPGS